MKHITDYTENGRTFIICKDKNERFWAFEDKYVKNGRLTKQFNGITGKASNSLENTLQLVHDAIVYDKLIASGVSSEDALKIIFNNI